MYDVLIGIDNAEDSRAIAQGGGDRGSPDGGWRGDRSPVSRVPGEPEGPQSTQISAVRRARETLEEAGINCVHYEASGDPTDELLAAADDIDADAICVSGRKRRPTGKAVFGSVTQDVILGADRPIFAVPAPRSD